MVQPAFFKILGICLGVKWILGFSLGECGKCLLGLGLERLEVSKTGKLGLNHRYTET